MRSLLALVALAGCSKSSQAPAPPPPPIEQPGRDASAGVVAPPVDAAIDVPAALVTSSQLVTAIVPDWTATTAELRLWQRDEAGPWRLVKGPWAGVVGTAGVAWGIGLHGAGAPAGHDGPVKREGDSKSPAGAFAVRKSYGYAKAAPAGTTLAYQPVDDDWQCVDDAKSTEYTHILDRRATQPDWGSAEQMRRKDVLYTWVVDVAHNPDAQPAAGSCIFLHVWRGEKSATVGCTAMAEPELAALIQRLEPSATYVLLPRAEYEALAASWGLP